MYSVLWVDRWDHEAGEPRGGGRCLAEAPALAEASRLAEGWADRVGRWQADRLMSWFLGWLGLGYGHFGDGAVVITDRHHDYVGSYRPRPAGRLPARADLEPPPF